MRLLTKTVFKLCLSVAAVIGLSVAARAMDVTITGGSSHSMSVFYQVSFEDVDPSQKNTFATLQVFDPSGNLVQNVSLTPYIGTLIDSNQDYEYDFTVSGPDGTYQVVTQDGFSSGWGLTSSVNSVVDNDASISTSASPSNGGTTAGDGTFQVGSSCTVTASAASGYTFVNWTENGSEVSTSASYTFTVSGDRSLTANFSTVEYTLTTGTTGDGTGSVSGGGRFPANSTLQVSVSPGVGSYFAGWTGDASGTSNPISVVMDSDKTVTAIFNRLSYTLTVSSTPGGSASGGGLYKFGDTAQLAASADPGYMFAGWSGAISGNQNPTNVTVTADTTVTASFTPIPYTVTASTVGQGSVGGAGTFTYGSTCTLTATPGPGYHFVGWSGAVSGTSNPLSFTVTGDASITATFEVDRYTVTTSALGGGSVSGGGTYDYGSTATITATPDAGYQFTGFSGAISGTQNPQSFTVTGDASITASFTAVDFSVSTSVNTSLGGNGSVSGGGSFSAGSTATLTASPDNNSDFDHWSISSGSGTSTYTSTTVSISVDSDVSAVAYFKSKQTPTTTAPGYANLTYGGTESPSPAASASSGATPTYSSNNTGVLTVDPSTGKITAVGVGSTTIIATFPASGDYSGTSVTSGLVVVSQATPTTTAPTYASLTYGTSEVPSLAASSSSGATPTYSSNNPSVLTVDQATGKITAIGVGSATITANFAATTNYTSASVTSASITVSQATPTATAPAYANLAYGASESPSPAASCSSGAAPTYSSGNTSVLTVDPATGKITAAGAGSTTITATFAATANYIGTSVTSNVITVSQATPTTTAPGYAGLTYGTSESPNPVASASSGATPTYSSNNTSVLTVDPSTGKITAVGVGSTTITATFPASGGYSGTTVTSGSIVVSQATPSTVAPGYSGLSYGTSELPNPVASSSSGATPTYSSNNPSVLTVDATSGKITAVGVGSATITATFAATTNYTSTSVTSASITVSQATPTATAPAYANLTYGTSESPNPAANASSGATPTYSSNNASVLTVDPATGKVTAAGVGSTTITATFAATTNYTAATVTSNVITVSQATPTPTAPGYAALTYGASESPNPIASASSGATPTYSSNNASVLTVDPSTGKVTAAGVGSTTITATFAATTNYTGASVTSNVITVSQATPTPTTPGYAALTYGASESPNPIASVRSGATPTYSSNNASVLTVDPSTGKITAVGVGSTTITATFAATTNYTGASVTSNVITVSQAAPTTTVPGYTGLTYGMSESPSPGASANSGAVPFYTSSNPSVLTVDASTGNITAVGVGTATVTATFPATANYLGATVTSAGITVAKATPVISWPIPGAISYGTALSGLQLDAAANVPGSFTYNPVAGTVLGAGTQTLTATFTPTDSTDYSAASASVTLVVTKASPTLTWATPAAITYGTALGGTQLNATASVPGTFSYSPPAGTVLNAGAHTLAVTFVPSDTTNYNTTTIGTTLNVNQATLTVTAADQSRVYGAANPAFTITYSGFVNGDTVAALSTIPTASTLATTTSQVGSYPITVSGGAAGNYAFTYVNGTLTVVKATPTIVWPTPAAITYGTALGATQLNATANVPGTFSYSPGASTVLAAGTQTLSVVLTPNDTVDYNSANSSVTLTVAKASLAITANDQTRIYGAANPELTLSYSGFVNGDTAVSLQTQATASTTAAANSPVGTYPIVVSGASSSNYTITYGTGTLTVTAEPVTFAFGALSVTYDGQAKAAAVTPSDSSATFTVSYAGTAGTTYGPSANPPNGAGTYAVTATANGNYTGTGSATLTIAKAVPAMTWAAPAAITYGTALGANQLNATANTPGTFVYTPGNGAVLNAGAQTLSVAFTPTDGADYTTAAANVSLLVNKAALTITANNQTKVYGDALPALTVSYAGFVNGDTVASLATPPTVVTTATASSSVGTYPITASGAASANYSIAYVPGQLTVTAKPISFAFAGLSFTYDGSPKAATVTPSDSSATFTVTYAGVSGTSYGPSAAAPTGAGTYSVTVAANGNYSGTASALLTIAKATPVVSWTAPAAITYGTALSSTQLDATANVAGAFIYTPAAGAILSAGTHSLAVAFTPTDSADYTTASASVSLTVNRAPLTATADNQSRAYGAANPPLTITYQGFVNGDTAGSITAPVASTTATTTSAVGSYPITLSGGSAANYTLTLVGGTLTVTAANVTFSFGPTQFTYDAAPQAPAVTASIAGATYSVSYQSNAGTPTWAQFGPSASLPTNATSYTVTATATGNYAGTSSAQFVIAPKPVTWTWTPSTFAYDGQPHVPTLTPSDPQTTFELLEVASVTDAGTPQQQVSGNIVQSIAAETNVGSYLNAVIAIGNYINDPQPLGGAADKLLPWSITPATLTVTADNQTRAYGSDNPALTVSYSGFVNGETSAALSTLPTATTSATATSAPGAYAIVPSDGVATNYTFNYVNGTLTVTKATASVSLGNLQQVYDGSPESVAVTTTPSGLSVSVTYDGNTTAPTDVGSYPVVANINDPDYQGSATGTLVISPAAATFAVGPTNFVYDGTAKTVLVTPTPAGATYTVMGTPGATAAGTYNFSVTATGNYSGSAAVTWTIAQAQPVITWNVPAAIVYGTPLSATQLDATANVPGTFTYSPAAGDVLGAGTHTLAATFAPADPSNYMAAAASVPLTVNKAVLSVTANDVSRVYGTGNPPLALTYSGFVNGDTASSLPTQPVATTSATTGSPVGSYPIIVSGGVSPNYAFVYTTGTLTVTPEPVTFSFASLAVTYDGAAKPAAVTPSDTAATYTVSYVGANGTSYGLSTSAPVNAGTYTVTATANGNYSGSSSATLTIAKATPVISWSAPAAITYGTALDATQLNATANVPGVFTYTPAAGTVLNAGGSQTLNVSFTPSDPANYTNAAASTTITVDKAPLTIKADDKSRVYGTPNPAFTVTYTGFVNGDTAASLATQPSLSTTATTSSSVGAYPIVAGGAASPNYVFTYVDGTLTITPEPVTFSFGNLAVTYDGTPKPATITPSDSAATYTVSYVGTNGISYGPSAAAPVNAGTYTVTATANGNYSGNGSATLTIAKATPVISWPTPAAITYGTALDATQLNATANVPGVFAYAPAAGTVLNAGGAQTLNVSFTPSDPANYTNAAASTTITVDKAPLTIKADDKSRVYGTPNPAFTVTYTGFVNGDTAASLATQPNVSTTATTSSSVGAYPIVAGGAASPNYAFTYVNGTLTITPEAVTFSFGSLAVTYDGTAKPAAVTPSDTAATYTVSYVGANGISYGPSASAPVNAGTYTVTATANGNYSGDASATLTIAKANPVIGWATPAAITYGTALGSIQLDATADVAGTFTYIPAAGTVLSAGAAQPLSVNFTPADTANYTNATGSTTITVTPASLTVTADDKTRIYGVANPTFTLTYVGFVNGDSPASLTTQPSGATTATTTSLVGTYPITVSGGVSSNYAFTYVDGTLTITAAQLAVTINGPAPDTTAAVQQAITFSGAFTFTGDPGAYAATWTFTPASGKAFTVAGTISGNTISDSIPFQSSGVYDVTLTVTQTGGAQGSATTVNGQTAYVVIYDPSAQPINGSPDLDVPQGTMPGQSVVAAKFHVNLQYKPVNGVQIASGTVSVSAGGFQFDAQTIDWIASDFPYGEAQGTGVSGATTYSFRLNVMDGGPNVGRIRLIIWNADGIVFDNEAGAPLNAPLGSQTIIQSGKLSVH